MWNIRGKKYDFTSFIDRHPGGKFILERTRGLPDITALFESYHAFSDIEKIEETMKKYEIKDTTATISDTTTYTTDFTSYRELVKRVRTKFPNSTDADAYPREFLFDRIAINLYSIGLKSSIIAYMSLHKNRCTSAPIFRIDIKNPIE